MAFQSNAFQTIFTSGANEAFQSTYQPPGAAPTYELLPSPYDVSWEQWTSTTTLLFSKWWQPMYIPESEWRQWAALFRQQVPLMVDGPSPEGFADWREWAAVMVGVAR